MADNQMRIFAVVVYVIAAIALIAAILYFALPADSLPGFLPGHLAHITGHRNRRGIGALVLAILLGAIGFWASRTAKAQGSQPSVPTNSSEGVAEHQ